MHSGINIATLEALLLAKRSIYNICVNFNEWCYVLNTRLTNFSIPWCT